MFFCLLCLPVESLDMLQEALDELTVLESMVPKESGIYFLKGQIYKKLGQSHLSLMNLSWAMELDPRGVSNSQLKELFEQQYGNQIQVLEDVSEDDDNGEPLDNIEGDLA
jgi:hypothetical protein